MIEIGVVAGTHPRLAPRAAERLSGVSQILHAGGIGDSSALDTLMKIAPLTAVIGERDYLEFSERFPETTELEVAGVQILLTHLIGSPTHPMAAIRARLETAPPAVIVYAGTPRAQVQWVGGTLYFSPGWAGIETALRRIPTCGRLTIAAPGQIDAMVLEL